MNRLFLHNELKTCFDLALPPLIEVADLNLPSADYCWAEARDQLLQQ